MIPQKSGILFAGKEEPGKRRSEMKKIFPAVIALMLFLLPACVRGPQPASQSQPTRSENPILVQFFEFPPQVATHVQSQFVANFGELIAYDIQSSLKRNGFPRVFVVKPGEALKADLLVRGSIIRVSGGNFFHRVSGELFGFGASEVRAEGELVDLKTATPLTGFSFSKKSRWSGLNNEAAVRENLADVAFQIAQLVGQYY
jgi:hypothetical protein